MNRGSACVLISGGADSRCLLDYALKRYKKVYPVYIACKLRWEKAEINHLKQYLKTLSAKNLEKLKIIDVNYADDSIRRQWYFSGKVPGAFSDDSAVYLPGRNVLTIGLASAYCAHHKILDILIGTLKSNPFSDASKAFYRSYAQLLRKAYGYPLTIKAPFIDQTKKSLMLRYQDKIDLRNSFSCLNPDKDYHECGRCNKCAEKYKVL